MICKLIYKIALLVIFPIVFIYLIFCSIYLKDINFFLNKIGYIGNLKNKKNSLCIHCASLGEINGIKSLIKKIKNKNTIIISTNTISGKKRAQELFPELDVIYFPLDYKIFITSWLNSIKFRNILIYETEIWPNFYELCNKIDINIGVINARFSKKILNGNKIIKNLYRQSLNKCSFILCKSNYEKNKYLDLEINKKILFHLGNLKYSCFEDIEEKNKKSNDRNFFLMASTHKPDEEIFKSSINYLLEKKVPIVIAPRHINRANEIIKYFNSLNIKIKTYSEFSIHSNKKYIADGIIVLDTFGDLIDFYNEAKFVYVGGGFSDRGVQNILEPAAFGRAVFVGPNFDNVKDEIKDLKIRVINNRNPLPVVIDYIENVDPDIAGSKTKIEFVKFSGILDEYINFLKKEKIIN
ncbi:hypothetical protein N9W73_00795 [Gammaproteobacteria bacterium]|nr:hypothetical protein [Gammaproteobacteria bacterium]